MSDVASKVAQKRITITFEREAFEDIIDIANCFSMTETETVKWLVNRGKESLDAKESILLDGVSSIADRRLTLISDIFDFSRIPVGTWKREDLELLDDNISDRIAAELNYAPETQQGPTQ